MERLGDGPRPGQLENEQLASTKLGASQERQFSSRAFRYTLSVRNFDYYCSFYLSTLCLCQPHKPLPHMHNNVRLTNWLMRFFRTEPKYI